MAEDNPNNIPEGPLPEPLLDRREVIKKIEASGLDKGIALKALIDEAAYVLRIREDDVVRKDSPSEISEARVIGKVTDFGFDPHNAEDLRTAVVSLSRVQGVLHDAWVRRKEEEREEKGEYKG